MHQDVVYKRCGWISLGKSQEISDKGYVWTSVSTFPKQSSTNFPSCMGKEACTHVWRPSAMAERKGNVTTIGKTHLVLQASWFEWTSRCQDEILYLEGTPSVYIVEVLPLIRRKNKIETTRMGNPKDRAQEHLREICSRTTIRCYLYGKELKSKLAVAKFVAAKLPCLKVKLR